MHSRQRISSYEHDPERIVALEEQLNGLRELKRKHRMDEPGLLKLRGDIQTKLALLDNSGQNTAQARVEVEKALQGYRAMLREFIGKRKDFSQGLCTRITRDLKDLGMTDTQFTLQQLDPDALDDALLDAEGTAVPPSTLLRGEFLISTNVGQNLLPLVKIASGGEPSRIMLAIKVQQKALNEATLVFDEIDSGISGQTAFAIAGKLKDLSKHAQAIVVTHLHQVAPVADSHFVITKQTSGKSTTSTLHQGEGHGQGHGTCPHDGWRLAEHHRHRACQGTRPRSRGPRSPVNGSNNPGLDLHLTFRTPGGVCRKIFRDDMK
ncbi:MAG: hypothetical protein MZV49_15375 [Rhodopseudomonas palustris]|nr:hypothetical protein [Rhodopseudomonas palustris]